MIISDLILEYLKQNGTVKVPGFGIFTLENANAQVSPDQKIIRPPSRQISFTADYEMDDREFLRVLSASKQLSEADANYQLTQQTDFWKNKLLEDQNLDLQPLGVFRISGDTLVFEGARLAKQNPDYYGLEEINLADIRKKDRSSSYTLNKTLLWTLLSLGLVALGATAYFNQELIFGKRSFPKVQPEEKIVGNTKPDSTLLRLRTADSTRTDSLVKDSTIKAAALPAKKGSGKQFSKRNKWSN